MLQFGVSYALFTSIVASFRTKVARRLDDMIAGDFLTNRRSRFLSDETAMTVHWVPHSCVAVAVLVSFAPASDAAELKVLSPVAMRGAMTEISGRF
jgi:hypothetical protein